PKVATKKTAAKVVAKKVPVKRVKKAAAPKPVPETAELLTDDLIVETLPETPVVDQTPETGFETAPVKTAPVITPNMPVLLERIIVSLDGDKAENIVPIELTGRSALCDWMVVATGTSTRHVASMAEHLVQRLKETGYSVRPPSGVGQGDWALVDAGDVIVHIFRPEVRTYYDIEGMWSVPEPEKAPKPQRAPRKGAKR
ncbi:MAG: ribosome silencing factor, partial [Rhizomicrobium sp.]